MTTFLRTIAWYPKKDDTELIEKIEKICTKKEWSISKAAKKLCEIALETKEGKALWK